MSAKKLEGSIQVTQLLEHIIVIEDASLEIVPDEIVSHSSCKLVQKRFNVPPALQILDDNFHGQAMRNLNDREKRGRPDVVHFALLDITSTPLYIQCKVAVFVHTIKDVTIQLKDNVRLPRTLNRFNGVISKILSGEVSQDEKRLFEFTRSQSFSELISEMKPSKVISFSTLGSPEELGNQVAEISMSASERILWIIGGFPFGHFDQEVIKGSDQVISISQYSLPAHVVSARLCYELESSRS
ncbi:MAG: hypothetical protein ACYC7D_07990 [Nitrososphaerales archaeon]